MLAACTACILAALKTPLLESSPNSKQILFYLSCCHAAVLCCGVAAQALYDEMKFERPSKIQATTLPMILRKSEHGVYRDLIAQAHNGSGKTTCFVLAMLSRCVQRQRTAASTQTCIWELGQLGCCCNTSNRLCSPRWHCASFIH